jgi:hypothetical protein
MESAAKSGAAARFFPLPNRSRAVAGDEVYGIKQRFQQDIASFDALQLNTPLDTDSNALLVAEGQQMDIGGNVVEWERTYMRVPATWSDYDVIQYLFPGYPGYAAPPGPGLTNSRNPYSPLGGVRCRIQYDYFVFTPDTFPLTGVKDSAGNDITVVGIESDIPILPRQAFYQIANPTIFYDPPSVVPAGGLFLGGLYYTESVPNRAAWDVMVAAGTEIIATDSQIKRFAGNIWERATRYVVAQ